MTLDQLPEIAPPQKPSQLTQPPLDSWRSPKLDYDLAIVGGGIVGLTLACALKDSGLRVALIEAQSLEQAAARRQAYALSLLSGRIFEGIGVWPQISPNITHFQRVRLSDADYPKVVEFRPEDLKTEAVYYGAEHSVLITALQNCVRQCGTVNFLCPARLISVDYQPQAVQLKIEMAGQVQTLRAQLMAAADGARSRIRQQAGIRTVGWKYWQSCITAVLKPEKPHQNIAYERFWPNGPFAILPIPHNRCQIVWTVPHTKAETILALPSDQFLAELSRHYGNQMGSLTLVSQPRLFQVQLMQSNCYVRPRLALIGDAAHCCHPVGGQGLNMGIRDAAVLAQVLQTGFEQGEDIGELHLLKRYERWRRRENWLVLGFTDFLNRCFSNTFLPLVILRRLGIQILQTIPPLKRLMLRLMTGFLGRIPDLARHSVEK
ncbi:MAG: FAD-dependent hydroxylase [Pseudanabaenales cyanobacterium]|nr:FAD-dependent hydroxylase [Pseudanabaenales cyanobacterium]